MSDHHTNENEKNMETFQEKKNGGVTYIILKSPSHYNEVRSVIQAISEERIKKGAGAKVKIKSLRAGTNNSRFYKAISFFQNIEDCIQKLDEKLIREPDKRLQEWNRKIFGERDTGPESLFDFGTQMDDRTGHAVKTLGFKDAVHVVHCDSDSIVICDSADSGCSDNNYCNE